MNKILVTLFVLSLIISCSNVRNNKEQDTDLINLASNIKDKLEEQEHILELRYIAWACDCANWTKLDDIKIFHDTLEKGDNIDGDFLSNLCVFVEPAEKSLVLPDNLEYSGNIIKFTGRFYKRKGFPKGYKSFQNPDKAKVFRYTKYEVIKSNYGEVQKLNEYYKEIFP